MSSTIGISPSGNFATKSSERVRGACPHDCPDTCALVTTVRDGVVIEVRGNPEHRHTQGALCTKVSRYAQRTYHTERLLYPMRRRGPKGTGSFERVSWDDALGDIARRLEAIAVWWRKLGLQGTNVNQLTSQNLTDLGRGPVFYDCLVEVRAA